MNDIKQWMRNAEAEPRAMQALDAAIDASPARLRLRALQRDLQPESLKLCGELAQLFAATQAAHRGSASRRPAHALRRWRALAALAAALIAAVAVWDMRHRPLAPPAPVAAAAVQDRIFAGLDDHRTATANRGDQIFRGNFLPDEIFNASRHHEG